MDLIHSKDCTQYRDQKTFYKRTGFELKNYNVFGVSLDNEYIPLFAPKNGLNIYNRKVLTYSILKEDQYRNNLDTLKNYKDLYENLNKSSRVRSFKTRSMEHDIKVLKGAIFENLHEDKIDFLFLIAVKTEYMIKFVKTEDEKNLDKSQFVIFVSSKFMTDPSYKSLYNKLYKDIIVPQHLLGVDLIVTNNISEKCFNNNIKIPPMKTLTEFRDFLSDFNNLIYGKT